MTWKPIDLAPRDGTVILACAPPEAFDVWTQSEIWAAPKSVSWRAYQSGPRLGPATWRDAKGLACRPTHFMPLPEPPALVCAGPAERMGGSSIDRARL